MRTLILILMLPLVCLGQHPLLTGSGIDWSRASSGALPPGDMWTWLKTEGITGTNTGQVITANWPDSSGNGHPATPTSGGVGVTNNVVNGHPAVYTQGSQYFTLTGQTAMFQNVDGGALFMVVTNQDLEGTYLEVRTGTASNNRFSTAWVSAGKFANFSRALDADAGSTSASIPVPRGFMLLEVLITYTNQTMSIYTNSVLCTSSTTFTTANKTSNTASTADPRIGQDLTGITGISEVIIYNRPVSTSERTTLIEPYFRTKFALF